jgi:hypothetical protein
MWRFNRRFTGSTSRFQPDDSLQNSEFHLEDSCLIEDLYIIGAYPWETDSPPRVLYSAVEPESSASSLAQFVLPGGCKFSTRSFTSSPDYLSSLYGPYAIPMAGHFIHYFSQTQSYLFFCRFTVNPLTIPSLAHEFSLPDLLSRMSPGSYPTCEMVLAFRTKAPFPDLFATISHWILQEETLNRLTTFPIIERFLTGLFPSGEEWPTEHRARLQTALSRLLSANIPAPGEALSVHVRPFDRLSWRRPRSGEPDEGLARSVLADVFRTFKPKTLAVIFSALLLEKSIVIFHTDEAVVNRVILGLHLLLKPLRWVSCSVSLLPPDLSDVLDAPTPLLVGVSTKQRSPRPGLIYVDLTANSISSGGTRLPMVPKGKGLNRDFAKIWPGAANGWDAMPLLGMANGIVNGLLSPVQSSIVTDFSDFESMRSKFFMELYLKQFTMAERAFAQVFAGTQMFQLYVEHQCRTKTDEMRRAM